MTLLLMLSSIAISLLCLAGALMYKKLKPTKHGDSAIAILLLPYSLFSVLLVTFISVRELVI